MKWPWNNIALLCLFYCCLKVFLALTLQGNKQSKGLCMTRRPSSWVAFATIAKIISRHLSELQEADDLWWGAKPSTLVGKTSVVLSKHLKVLKCTKKSKPKVYDLLRHCWMKTTNSTFAVSKTRLKQRTVGHFSNIGFAFQSLNFIINFNQSAQFHYKFHSI